MNRLTPMERLRRSGIQPERAYGQNFLIDANIIAVIERLAELGSSDIVLEVGPGLGVLTEKLVDSCGMVHCIEVDARLGEMLRAEFVGSAHFRLYMADAVRFSLSELDPPPVKFVANLPYNVAVPLIMKSFVELPSLELWCLMLQKEIADRLFAATGSKNYGAVSVMTQLLTVKVAVRPVAASVFFPQPRVQSSLLVFHRRPGMELSGAPLSRLKAVVYGSFSHRRKTLVNSLADAEVGLLPASLPALSLAARKREIAAKLDSLGLPANVRPQQLSPEQFVRFAASWDDYDA